MRSDTCLQTDQRGLQVRCESNQLPLGELLLQQYLAVIAEHTIARHFKRFRSRFVLQEDFIWLSPHQKPGQYRHHRCDHTAV